MPISRVTKWNPIPGDDMGFVTIPYRDVPEGFRITDLEPLAVCPLSASYWDRLTTFADSFYRNHEIVGQTFVDFFENLRMAYQMNADTLEKALEVYYDDISKPTQSRTIKRTHSEDETLPNPERTTETEYGHKVDSTNSSSGSVTNIEYAIEGSDSSPSDKSDTESEGSTGETHSGTDKVTESETGGSRHFESEDTEDWSDVGVAPNYELLNGFLDNNRTMENIFVNMFNDCFTIRESMYW